MVFILLSHDTPTTYPLHFGHLPHLSGCVAMETFLPRPGSARFHDETEVRLQHLQPVLRLSGNNIPHDGLALYHEVRRWEESHVLDMGEMVGGASSARCGRDGGRSLMC